MQVYLVLECLAYAFSETKWHLKRRFGTYLIVVFDANVCSFLYGYTLWGAWGGAGGFCVFISLS